MGCFFWLKTIYIFTNVSIENNIGSFYEPLALFLSKTIKYYRII